MKQQRTWEAALKEAEASFEQQNQDFDTAMSLLQQAGNSPIEVDERSLRALAESTTTISVCAALPQSNCLAGSRC